MKLVQISACVECPHINNPEATYPKCGNSEFLLKGNIYSSIDEKCGLQDASCSSEKDHISALKYIYGILQKKGMNPDSLHDANVFLDDYIKKI